MTDLRSEQRDKERLRASLMRLQQAGKLADAAEAIPRLIVPDNKIWKGGIEPMAFDAFCVALDGNHMFPRQADAWDYSNTIRASRIMRTANTFLTDPRSILEYILIFGKGSGKGYISAKFLTWLAYLLLMMAEDPCTYMMRTGKNLDLAAGSKMEMINIAPTEKLAIDVFFHYLTGFMRAPIMDPFPKTINNASVKFANLNLSIYALTSSERAADGYNIFAYALDEAAAFLDMADHSVAESLHSICRSSCRTRFGGFGVGLVLSYPRKEDDYVMRLEKLALEQIATGEPPLYYVDRAATHEIKPNFDINDPMIQEEFRVNPQLASAQYLCLPMAGESVFFKNADKIMEAIDPHRVPICVTEQFTVNVEMNDGSVVKREGIRLVSEITHTKGHTHFVGVDGGKSGDSYAISVFHIDEVTEAVEWFCPVHGTEELRSFATYERIEKAYPMAEAPRCGFCYNTPMQVNPHMGIVGWWRRLGVGGEIVMEERGEKYSLPLLYEDFLAEIVPFSGAGKGVKNRDADYTSVQTLLEAFCDHLNVKVLAMDPWNTTQMGQGIQARKGVMCVESKQHNPEQYKRARLLKWYLSNNAIHLLPGFPVRTTEWRRLQDLGNKVDHPKNGRKDYFDSESNATWQAAIFRCGQLEAGFI